jgi:hypothetical protein
MPLAFRRLTPVIVALGLTGCGGGGHATPDGAGGAGGLGSIDGGGGSDGGREDRACGRPGQTYTFLTEQVKILDDDIGYLGAVLRRDDSPVFIYQGGPVGQVQVWAVAPPDRDDAGVSVSIALQISRPSAYVSSVVPWLRRTTTGDIRVAYFDQLQQVRYVEWNGDLQGTPTDTMIAPSSASTSAAFDLDSQDHAGLVHFPSATSVAFVSNTTGSWQTSSVSSNADPALKLAMTYGAGADPVVFAVGNWMAMGADRVNLVTRASSGWTGAPLDPQDSYGVNVAFAGRDASGQVQLFYDGLSGPRRVVGNPGSWDLHASLPTGRAGSPAAVAFGSGSEVHLLYERGGASGVDYAYFDGCRWTGQTVDADGVGRMAVAVDAAGAPHIVYEKSRTPSTAKGIEIWYAHPSP